MNIWLTWKLNVNVSLLLLKPHVTGTLGIVGWWRGSGSIAPRVLKLDNKVGVFSITIRPL